jgi:hypothetical protein
MAKDSNARIGQFTFNVPVPMVYPHLLEPKAYDAQDGRGPQGEPKYQGTFVFPADSEELKAAKAVAGAVAKAAFPGKPLADIVFPFKLGDRENAKRTKREKAAHAWQAGKVLLPTTSKDQPRLSCLANGRIADLDNAAAIAANSKQFYSGVQVLSQVNFTAWGDPNWEKGDPEKGIERDPEVKRPRVVAYVNQVLSTGKGERIGGAVSAAETFSGYAGKHSAEDPTQGMADDEIPY